MAGVLWLVEGKEIRAAVREDGQWSKSTVLSKIKGEDQDLEEPLCKVDREGNVEAYWHFSDLEREIDRFEGKIKKKGRSSWGKRLIDCDLAKEEEEIPRGDNGEQFLYSPYETKAMDREGSVCIAGRVNDQSDWPGGLSLYTQFCSKEGIRADPMIVQVSIAGSRFLLMKAAVKSCADS